MDRSSSLSSAEAGERSPAAVIWISGLGAPGIEEGLEEVAKRVAFAFDRDDAPEATFAVRTAIKPEPVGSGLTVPRCTVFRSDATGTRAVLDFYGLATAATLIGDRSKQPLGGQLWSAVRTVYRALGRARKARSTGGMVKRERLQLAIGYVALLVSVLGLVVLLGTAAGTVGVALLASVPDWLAFVLGPVGALGGLSIWKSATARKIGGAALVVYSVIDYLDRSNDKGSLLRGQLAQLLEHLAELKQPHASVDVVAYSFGSIVAIDAFFPYVQAPPRRLTTTNSLITIACPFDFVRSYWPGYFTGRFSRAGAPAAWVNFYAPSDVLASRFGDPAEAEKTAGAHGPAPLRVEVRAGQAPPPLPEDVPYLGEGREEPVSLGQAVALKGLRVHGQYWSSRVANEEGVWIQVIDFIGKPVADVGRTDTGNLGGPEASTAPRG